MPDLNSTIEYVKTFANLPIGWNYGEGGPVAVELIDKAIEFLNIAAETRIKRMDAFPGSDCQLQITFYIIDRMLEINFENNGEITVLDDYTDEFFLFREGDNIKTIFEDFKFRCMFT